MSDLGLLYVFTGEGKGKTSAAIGTAIRAVGAGMKVAWVAWYKQESWKLAELKPLRKLGVEVYLMGKGFWIEERGKRDEVRLKTKPIVGGQVVVDSVLEADHKQAAKAALDKAKEFMGKVDLLVLDEVNNAVDDGLIDLINLIDLISKRNKTHVILTGRNVHPKVVKIADLVTEMKKVKHPYDRGMLAIRGLDF